MHAIAFDKHLPCKIYSLALDIDVVMFTKDTHIITISNDARNLSPHLHSLIAARIHLSLC